MKYLYHRFRKVYRSIKFLPNRIRLLAKFLCDDRDKTERVFCISMQRTGTTSVGKFLKDFGYRCSGWTADEKNEWSKSWYEGDYERIFSSTDFIVSNAFEDSPWFLPDFYKYLYHRFPNSKFILLTRDLDAWFKSMLSHSQGNVLGKSRVHAKIYRREMEYFDLLLSDSIDEKVENALGTDKTMKLAGFDKHYKELYRLHSMEVQDFFKRNSPNSLFVCKLEDTNKWKKLGVFLGVDVPDSYDAHENSSNQ